jgi:hypothetical protein
MFRPSQAFHPKELGYRIAFHNDGPNHCPSCGKSNWIVGRMTAECAFCATALPLEGGSMAGVGLFRTTGIAPRRLAA